MSRPVVGSFAEDLYTCLSPLAWDDENQDWALLHLCQAIGLMFQPVEDVARDTVDGPGWSQAMDPDRAPSWLLGWLSQFGGVSLTAITDEAAQRQAIKDRAASKRGRPATIATIAKNFLTGTKSVFIDERLDGDAYSYAVITRISETPDPSALETAMKSRTVKPAGLNVEVTQTDGMIWDEAIGSWDDSLITWDEA